MTEFDIAAICAHPDDAEITMGGTIALETRRGRRVALVDLTRGESGSRGTPETRAAEAEEGRRILGAAHRESLGLPDSGLTPTPEQRDVVVEALRRLRPRVVMVQHWLQRHPDHAAASRLVYEASFVAGLKAYRPELGAAFRPAKLVYAPSVTEAEEAAPSFVVDITSVWETKMAAVEAFGSQFKKGADENVKLPFDGFRAAAELSARRAGQRIGVEFGEAWVTREPLAIADVGSLGGRSF